ncbi:lipocalin family protein [Rufibacter tibetensis]|uniref:Lipocalin-like domain-containing protein n=1 Tax=Rufibacter tibetensis TaxID=512763 RepID=A0A0P0CXH0_9BACT|nr:lipocalin family protein [Rufibacter tibetensis]ALI99097.1 hypothetical protein DC20_09060 [Rufibacter tibetensis]
MKNYPLLLLLFCCALVFNGCSSDDDDPSQEDMLKNKRWQITALDASTPIGDYDFYADMEDCQRDNFVEFEDDEELIIDEGATKCRSSDPQRRNGSWTLKGNILTLRGIGEAYGLPEDDLELTVTELTSTSLTANFSQSVQGFPINGTVTMETM